MRIYCHQTDDVKEPAKTFTWDISQFHHIRKW